MRNKKLITLALCATMVVSAALSACGDAAKTTPTSTEKDTTITTAVKTEETVEITASEDTTPNTDKSEETSVDSKKPQLNPEIKNDTEHEIGYQLEMPQKGDEIAIIHTNMGDITLRLFPENAPKTVENFVTLAKEGKYDNTIFHRVVSDFMIQGGDFENSNGTGGYSIYGDKFEDEFCDTLYNIRGSISMANAGANTNGSQFFINQSKAESFNRDSYDYDALYSQYVDLYAQYVAYYGESFSAYFADADDFIENYVGGIYPLSYAVPEEVWALYEAQGGNISLDGALRASGGHTVFGQVIEGMDIVDKIAAVEVTENSSGEKSLPVEDVIVETIEITTY